MGLDCTFYKSGDSERLVKGDFVFASPFSWQDEDDQGQPFSTIRHHKIHDLILDLTGIEITTDESCPEGKHGWSIDALQVSEIARRLDVWLSAPVGNVDEQRLTRKEIADLALVFRRYGEAGFSLYTA